MDWSDANTVAVVWKHVYGGRMILFSWIWCYMSCKKWYRWFELFWLIWGQSNINSGLSNILCTPNGNFQRKLARLCFEELGDAFHVFVLGQIAFPFHMALKLGVNLVFYGENGVFEFLQLSHTKGWFNPVGNFRNSSLRNNLR